HPDTGRGQPVQGIDLGVLPDLFLHLAAIAAAFLHGARLPAVLDLAALLVGSRLAETALVRVLVDLGATDVLAAANDIDGGFLAAHQLAKHLVYKAFFNEGGESFRSFHGSVGFRRLVANDAEPNQTTVRPASGAPDANLLSDRMPSGRKVCFILPVYCPTGGCCPAAFATDGWLRSSGCWPEALRCAGGDSRQPFPWPGRLPGCWPGGGYRPRAWSGTCKSRPR